MSSEIEDSTVVVILDQKEDELVGFDFISFPEANVVSGIWNLTPGSHFMYIKNKEQGNLLDDNIVSDDCRLGEFIHLKRGEIKVYKRSQVDEGSLFELVEEYCNQKYKESIVMGHLRGKMSKIPENLSNLWASMTDCINSELILRLRPINKVITNHPFPQTRSDTSEITIENNMNCDIRSDCEIRNCTTRLELSDEEEDYSKTLEEYKNVVNNLSTFKSKVDFNKIKRTDKTNGCHFKEVNKPENHIDNSVEKDYDSIYYSDIPMCDDRIRKMKEITPEQITKMHMDTSYIIDSIRGDNSTNGYKMVEFKNKYFYVLGELQYSFLVFILCFNFESLEQYKRLLRAFCNAESLLVSDQELTQKLLKTLRFQIETWDEEHDVYQKDNFLTHHLCNLREIILDNSDKLKTCLDHFKLLEDSFKLKFGISLNDLNTIHSNII
ncbi:AAR2 family protein [Theileria parva strain Muguga]|uniref:AAR2 family protein n=1 Tax=Theileria parva strain Muguga TaxID=333668 RepID=UPI001C6193C5|nr:AAR2 family protein [Theileria parva strain Muguga]KAF5153484.1 AAR2 family protein [Theileria parva strain Muguga]